MIFPTVIPANAPPEFVLPASVAAAWGIPPRYTVYAHQVRFRLASGTPTVIATAWPLELAEELLSAVRCGDTTQQRADGILVALPALRIYLDELAPHRAWPEVLNLARTHSISVSNAANLELALRLNLPLATTDATLTGAANTAGVPIFAP
jgi:predicted nucleic acid-binding protein